MKNRNYSTPKEPPIATPRTRTKRKAGWFSFRISVWVHCNSS
jgi:hypothetical protein